MQVLTDRHKRRDTVLKPRIMVVLNGLPHECTQCRIILNIAWGTYSFPSPPHVSPLPDEAIT